MTSLVFRETETWDNLLKWENISSRTCNQIFTSVGFVKQSISNMSTLKSCNYSFMKQAPGNNNNLDAEVIEEVEVHHCWSSHQLLLLLKRIVLKKKKNTEQLTKYTQPAKLDTTPAQLIDESINAVLSPVSDLLRRPILWIKTRQHFGNMYTIRLGFRVELWQVCVIYCMRNLWNFKIK